MNFALAIVIYLIFFVIFLWVFSKYGMSLFSALTITAFLAALLLIAMVSPSEIERQVHDFVKDKPHHNCDNWIVGIYLLIILLTLILIACFIILKSWEDRARRLKVLGDDYLCDFNDYLRIW